MGSSVCQLEGLLPGERAIQEDTGARTHSPILRSLQVCGQIAWNALSAAAYCSAVVFAMYTGIGVALRYAPSVPYAPIPVTSAIVWQTAMPKDERPFTSEKSALIGSSAYQLRMQLLRQGVVTSRGRINRYYVAQDSWCFVDRPCWRVTLEEKAADTGHRLHSHARVSQVLDQRIYGNLVERGWYGFLPKRGIGPEE